MRARVTLELYFDVGDNAKDEAMHKTVHRAIGEVNRALMDLPLETAPELGEEWTNFITENSDEW